MQPADRAVGRPAARSGRIAAGELPETGLEIGVESLMTMMIGLQVTAVLGTAVSTRRSQIALLDSLLGATPE